jgi:(p)ppGpp synthase/HD superfamily hydrolase
MNSWEVQSARAYAAHHHVALNGQMHGDRPYVTHLDEVVGVLERYGIEDDTMLQAAYLHDVLEDCSVTRLELQDLFGKEVSDLVYAVTNESGKNRKERHLKTYPKILNHPNALILKLADRIANVTYSVLTKSSLLQMYRKEWPAFQEALRSRYSDVLADAMWEELDHLMDGTSGVYKEIDELCAKMQTPECKEGVKRAYDSTKKEK